MVYKSWRKSSLCISANAARMLLFLGVPTLLLLGWSSLAMFLTEFSCELDMAKFFKIALLKQPASLPRLHVADYIAQNTDPYFDASQRVGIPKAIWLDISERTFVGAASSFH